MIRVVTSAQAAARDNAAIAAGTPGRALMQRAGAAAAAEIALRYRDRLAGGVAIFAGPGNNGGDGWVVARALVACGARVRVLEPAGAKSADCGAERALAIADCASLRVDDADALHDGGESIVVDALLGTGASGAPRGDIARAVELIGAMRERGAAVIALDLPSGLDASTGELPGREASPVRADLTLTFGTMKRGLVRNRACCGAIAVIDIGLGASAELDDGAPSLVDEAWVASVVPPFAANAHKGTRRKLVIVGGHEGMAGAAVLAARGALRSGIGMVRVLVDGASLAAVQEAEPYALAGAWPDDEETLKREITDWADAVIIGPGLGRDDRSRAVLQRVLDAWRGPTLLDADAITLFAGDIPNLAARLGRRPALLTPHPLELARLTGAPADEVTRRPFKASRDAAAALGATVLLKGVPTIVSAPSGAQLVSAAGTPALATGGSGDVLSGIAGTLLAQVGDALTAGAAAAWVHGRAAERVPAVGNGARGITLDDIVAELRDGWSFDARPTRYPVLAELPAVGV